MHASFLQQFQRDGYAVLEDFLTPEEVSRLRKAGESLAADIPENVHGNSVFCPVDNPQGKDRYFLESGDKIRYFLEPDALDKDGKLVVDRSRALNKVGHALHWKYPEFREITFSSKVKEVCFQLGMGDPVIVQSMYIYKNPGIGSEVVPHQDATFLYTDPVRLVGLWFALDDATLQNGCLRFAPGSHCSGVHRRYIRNPDVNSEELLCFDKPPPLYPKSNFTPVPVSKGSCVLIHGQIVHQSEPNRSEFSRHAYTFHVIDQKNTTYAENNWLQPTEDLPFPSLYHNE